MIYLNFDLTVRMIMIVIMIMIVLFLGFGEVGGSVTAELSSCVGAIERRTMASSISVVHDETRLQVQCTKRSLFYIQLTCLAQNPMTPTPEGVHVAFGLLCGLEFSVLTNKLDFNFGRA